MKKMTRVSTVLLLTTGTLVAPCAKAQTQQKMNQQAVTEYQKADKELNAVYKKLLTYLSPDQKTNLIQAQRAWTTYRDAEMKFAADGFKGGSMSPMARYQAGARTTQSRVENLKRYLSDYSNR